jgi:hypothetical protein
VKDVLNPDDLQAKAFARSLIRAARTDMPPEGAHGRALRALTSGAIAGGAFGGVSTAAAAPKLALLATSLGIAKWGAVGVVAGVLTVGAAKQLGPSESTRTQTMVAPRTVERTPLAARAATTATTPIAESPAANDPPPPVPSTRERPSDQVGLGAGSALPAPLPNLATSDEPSAAQPDGLLSEVAILDQVRSLLLARDPLRALEVLDGYRSTWPRGRLGPEATVLRIEALVHSGRRTQAIALANEFLATHAATPFAHRIRTLVGIDGAGHASPP